MASHLDSSRNERASWNGNQRSGSIISFNNKEPEKVEEKKIVAEIKKPAIEQPKKPALCRVDRGCLTLGYEFDLYKEFNNLNLSMLLTKYIDINSIDKVELYSETTNNSIFLLKSAIQHYRIGEKTYKGYIFTGFELSSMCYPKFTILVNGTEIKVAYSQRRM